MQLIQKNHSIPLQPVYVLSSRNVPWINHLEAPPLKKFLPTTQKACEKWLEKVNVPKQTCKIIINEGNSRKAEVEALLQYAHEVKTQLIVVNTHARKGIERFFMGSFSESLLTHCHIPLLFLSPKIKPLEGLHKVLFPTDFSKNSLLALKHFGKTLAHSEDHITFYNQMSENLKAFSQSSVHLPEGSFVSYSDYQKLEKEAREEKAESFLHVAQHFQFQSQVHIENSEEPLVEKILDYAHRSQSQLIAMASESGPWTSLVLGSTVKNLIRQSDLPVWVYHT